MEERGEVRTEELRDRDEFARQVRAYLGCFQRDETAGTTAFAPKPDPRNFNKGIGIFYPDGQFLIHLKDTHHRRRQRAAPTRGTMLQGTSSVPSFARRS